MSLGLAGPGAHGIEFGVCEPGAPVASVPAHAPARLPLSHEKVASRMPVEALPSAVVYGPVGVKVIAAVGCRRRQDRVPVERARRRAARFVAVDLEPGLETRRIERRGCHRPRSGHRHQQSAHQCPDGDDRRAASRRHGLPFDAGRAAPNRTWLGTVNSESRGRQAIWEPDQELWAEPGVRGEIVVVVAGRRSSYAAGHPRLFLTSSTPRTSDGAPSTAAPRANAALRSARGANDQ